MWPSSRTCGSAEPRHPEHAVDVRVQHRRLVVGSRLRERRAAEREPGVVEEDVDPAEVLDCRGDERAARGLVRDVERQRDVGLDPLDPPRAADDAHARVAQLPHGRGADPRRRAGDDRRLAGQIHAREPNAEETWQRGSAAAKRRLQRCATPKAGIEAESRSADPARAAREGSSGGNPLLRNPARELAQLHALDRDRRSCGRSRASRSTAEMRSTTSWPDMTRPKTVCLPSSHGRRLGGDDEELRAVRVRPRVRHRERAARRPCGR